MRDPYYHLALENLRIGRFPPNRWRQASHIRLHELHNKGVAT